MTGHFGIKNRAISGSLLAAPAPCLDESPASWIQYVCSRHHYSITRLEVVLGVKPRFHDWDLRVSRQVWSEVLQRADCDPCSFAVAFSSPEYSATTSMGKGSLKLYDGPPKYRWCSSCLEEDARPYIRWWWRFPSFTHCPKHHSRLVMYCGNCKSELVLSYALMVNAGRRDPIPDLAHCQSCGLPRWLTQPTDSAEWNSSGQDASAASKPKDADEGKIDSFQQLKDHFKAATKPLWGEKTFLCDEMDKFAITGVQKKRSVLTINGSTFQPVSESYTEVEREKWSSRIERWRVPQREKLSYALRLIRREMRTIDPMTWRSPGSGVDQS